MELGSNGGAGDGERIAVGIARIHNRRCVGVGDRLNPPIVAKARRRCIAELVDTGDDAAKLVVARLRGREADLGRVVGLPRRNLAAEVVVAIASRQPGDVGHVERDQARGSDHASFCVVVPSRRRAVGLNFRNLMAAVPRRGRNLTGEVFGCNALAFGVVRHLVSGDSIPNSVYERLSFLLKNFAAGVGKRDIAGGLAGDGRG